MSPKLIQEINLNLFLRRACVAAAWMLSLPCGAANIIAPKPTDLGLTSETEIKNVSIVLKLRNRDQLEAFVNGTGNPQSPNYQKFLSVSQFTAAYAPLPGDVTAVVSDLQGNGITVSGVSANGLVVKASGTVGAFNHYFSTALHEYVGGAGEHYHAPATSLSMPSTVGKAISTVVGLSSQPLYHSRTVRKLAADSPGAGAVAAPTLLPGGTSTGIPGQFTVGDVADLYQVRPLYSKGFQGAGRTVGIATLASFNPADAYAYWAGIGLSVKPNRITHVLVDGGGDPSQGADETTLDIEQAGGLAPYADIVVYDAPNTDQGFLDVFLQAVVDNKADVLSTSWGLPEIALSQELTDAHDALFLEAAAQGITVFAASGDAGAFDVNSSYPIPQCSKLLSTDYPASSRYVTACGGLTLAGVQTNHTYPAPVVNVPQVRPWGWDYLADYANANYGAFGGYYGIFFPLGGGGGVSVNQPLPLYQSRTPGIKTSQPSQSLICVVQAQDGSIQFFDLVDMPDNQPGRNVPDLALNADPYTGYLYYYGGNWYAAGGTSFVSPQLNGITALISQYLHSRLGLVNPALYRLARRNGYGSRSPFNDVISGDNLGFQAHAGYDPAAGIGSINAANLARALANDDGDSESGD